MSAHWPTIDAPNCRARVATCCTCSFEPGPLFLPCTQDTPAAAVASARLGTAQAVVVGAAAAAAVRAAGMAVGAVVALAAAAEASGLAALSSSMAEAGSY